MDIDSFEEMVVDGAAANNVFGVRTPPIISLLEYSCRRYTHRE